MAEIERSQYFFTRQLLGKKFSAMYEWVMQTFSEPYKYTSPFIIGYIINLFKCSHISKFRTNKLNILWEIDLIVCFLYQDKIKCTESSIISHHLQGISGVLV